MSHRLRAILAGLLVEPLVTAATAFTDDRPDARVSGVRGVVLPVKPAAERADHPTQAAQLAVPADREKPWTLQDCRNEFKDVPRGSYEVSGLPVLPAQGDADHLSTAGEWNTCRLG